MTHFWIKLLLDCIFIKEGFYIIGEYLFLRSVKSPPIRVEPIGDLFRILWFKTEEPGMMVLTVLIEENDLPCFLVVMIGELNGITSRSIVKFVWAIPILFPFMRVEDLDYLYF